MDKIKKEQIERPLDLLNKLKGRKVLVKVKDESKSIEGELIAFDIHINIVLLRKELQFIRGERIISIS